MDNKTNAVQRTATRQLAGTVTVTFGSNTVTGVGTRFREQLKAGDRAIRGMTHVVAGVASNTSMNVIRDYRGVNTLLKVLKFVQLLIKSKTIRI